ncbi:MAG: phosphoenolpyruvate--protein phosphotransferase [Candidatus Riflebacteria bacterium]|nr:phosphoenolpyruvate--protein phosphotransferase [Candidatus Riflebacteria bacterium]
MLKGLSISPGYALGTIYCLKHHQLESIESSSILDSEIDAEIGRFDSALELSRAEIGQLLELPQIKSSLEISNIFQAHLTLLDDPDLRKEVEKRIKQQKKDVLSVVGNVVRDYSNFFRNLPDPQFQGKAIDIMDIGKRILKNCQKRKPGAVSLDEFTEGVIVVAEDLTPSEIVTFNPSRIKGIAIEEGTPTSHASILARSLGIPALIQVKDLMLKATDNAFAIIDSASGNIIFNPDAKTKDNYLNELNKYKERHQRILADIDKPSVTKDGIEITLKANIGQTADIESAVLNKAGGIGLYRTEFAYLTRTTFPTEEELFQSYFEAVEKLGDNTLVIRTIDIGGDKISHLMGNSLERNPELGWRAVRISLDCEDVFMTQLRAILRVAGKAGEDKIRILFPMISNIEELRKIKVILSRAASELRAEGFEVKDFIKIGIMVEVPSVALLADRFAKEVDFFAIGSNDLVQYTLAVDRTNSKVSHLYQPANPAVINLIKNVVRAGDKFSMPVSLCGEIAGDVKYTVLLIGLGLRELSMNSVLIPSVKQVVRNISCKEATELVAPLLELDTTEEIEKALTRINASFGLQ